jgi:hypothetical protein
MLLATSSLNDSSRYVGVTLSIAALYTHSPN